MNNIKLRYATDIDKENIYSLKKNNIYPYVSDIWGWDEEYQRDDFDIDFQSIDKFHVIEYENKFAGFYQVGKENALVNIEEIHLIEDLRGRGIGTYILKQLIVKYKKEENSLIIGCFKRNVGAKKLYESIGFKVFQETDTHFILQYWAIFLLSY